MRLVRAMLALAMLCAAAAASAQTVVHRAKGSFDSVREDLLLAIRDKGLVIDHTSHIGNMLERTGKDLGATQRLYDKAEAYVFCSSVVSRKAMEADAKNIALCPYVIALYTLPGEKDLVHLAYQRRLPEVDALLEDIVRDAAGK